VAYKIIAERENETITIKRLSSLATAEIGNVGRRSADFWTSQANLGQFGKPETLEPIEETPSWRGFARFGVASVRDPTAWLGQSPYGGIKIIANRFQRAF
jgi:hypothetical protein